LEGRDVRKVRMIAAAAVVAAGLTAVLVSSAQAHVDIGLIQGGTPEAKCTDPGDFLQFNVLNHPDYVVHENGVITSWSVNAGQTPNQTMTFKIYRETGSGYTVVAHDGPRTLGPGVNTFKVAIPVKISDTIGFSLPNASAEHPVACAYEGANGDQVYGFEGNAPDGGSLPEHKETKEIRLNVAATLLPPPSINIFGRTSLGPITGGGTVVLKGINFEEVSNVSFGGVSAKSFTVNSEQQITAVAPPGKTLEEVSASVTTPAGTAVYPRGFAYSGCVVPKLIGKKLSAAKTKIKASGCKLAKVKRVHGPASKRGKVVKQSPKPGQVGAPGTKVSIKVGA
jgi:PASTA domain/IPT/TIG domain